ncbi:MAG: TIGR03087 family PEP-CTERM/XrtA system glycosyltransferase [Rhodospirillales bacterium]|nr:MAG: TIGR03087 family PEP-CTERM/XrtA system glycosyltransferase [Rhodospirillales bacterium]
MRVLFVCHRMPYPPTDGARVRAYQIIRHLAARHELVVAAPARSPAERQAGDALSREGCTVLTGTITRPAAWARMVRNLATREPSSMGYFYSRELARRIRDAARSRPFDLVFVYCSSVAPYVSTLAGIPRVIDFVDMDSQKWLSVAGAHRWPLSSGYRLEGRKLQRAEAAIAAAFDLCLCITPAELATLRSYGLPASTATDWFPNGVDLAYFTPSDAPCDPDAIGFVGRMDYFPNQQAVLAFCDHVLPRIQAVRPAATFTIIGAEPTPAIRALGQRPGVTVTGTVADVRPLLSRCALSVAPLAIARGVQNKILESMAMGVPVVASSATAKGVEAVAGADFLVADDPDALAQACLKLMCHPEERARLARAGRELVERTYRWDAALGRLDTHLAPLLARTGADSRRDRTLAGNGMSSGRD